MRKWYYDMDDMRTALKKSYKIVRTGKNKYEAYTKYKTKGKSRKIIFAAFPNEIFIITGAEGK